tara:strand:+ start:137 stop:397 length:261 start_codon:yes stop_codon:yes gene_type:complete
MDHPDYLIINPLQIELLISDKTNNKINNKTNNKINKINKINIKRKLTEIEERFCGKMEKLKNISLQNKRLKHIIQHINHRLILVDV